MDVQHDIKSNNFVSNPSQRKMHLEINKTSLRNHGTEMRKQQHYTDYQIQHEPKTEEEESIVNSFLLTIFPSSVIKAFLIKWKVYASVTYSVL